MIKINKEETIALREKFPDVHIVRTMKKKSKRHNYYVVEDRAVVAYLDEIRSRHKTVYFGRGDDGFFD